MSFESGHLWVVWYWPSLVFSLVLILLCNLARVSSCLGFLLSGASAISTVLTFLLFYFFGLRSDRF